MSLIEKMDCDGLERFAYRADSPEFKAILADLEAQFGPINAEGWYSLSTPQYNEIYEDDVVSAVIQLKPPYLDFLNPAAVGRKFFLRKGWVYDKVYLFTTPTDCPLPHPQGATPMFIGYLVNVYGQPGDENLTRYRCLYFMHTDHAAVEAWAGKPLPQGAYSTFYAATFDHEDGNQLLRMKSYCYDEQAGFSDWDVKWLQECKRRGVEHYAESN